MGGYTAFGASVYYKPSLKKVVFRKPTVARKSPYIKNINDQFGDIKPATYCTGLDLPKFRSCLRQVLMKELKSVRPAAEREAAIRKREEKVAKARAKRAELGIELD